MKLTAAKRASDTKGTTKQARRDGKIPAVVYAPGGEPQSILISEAEFDAALRNLKRGRLATTTFTMELDGKSFQAIVKDIQYDLTSYKVIHLDFEELKDDVHVKVKVPIDCIGAAECVGIKLGGSLRQVIRSVQVKCLPKDIPAEFQLDIRSLKIKQSKRLSDLSMPEGVKPLSTSDEVVAVIAKR